MSSTRCITSREHRPDVEARRRLRGRRGKAARRSRPKTASPRSSVSWRRDLYDPSRSTTSTSSARRSRPRSSTRGTRTTSSPTRSEDLDEFTGRHPRGAPLVGRPPSGRRGQRACRISRRNHTWATGHVAELLRMYEKLSGMTGPRRPKPRSSPGRTGFRSSRSDDQPMIREAEPTLSQTEEAKFKRRRRHRRALRVGHRSSSGPLRSSGPSTSRVFGQKGIPTRSWNAKYHERSDDRAQAAGLHGVTVATNMAGRGSNILSEEIPKGSRTRARERGPRDRDGRGCARYSVLCKRFRRVRGRADKIRELGALRPRQ